MRKPLRTFLLVEARMDANDVPYLVADPSRPHLKVGIKHKDLGKDDDGHPVQPSGLDHLAERFEPHAHVVDATDPRHRHELQLEAGAGCLHIHGEVQAQDQHQAEAAFAALATGAAPPRGVVVIRAPKAAAQPAPAAPSQAAPAVSPPVSPAPTSAPAPAPAAKE